MVKALVHDGQPVDLSFYRDRKGEEVDLLVPSGQGLQAVEVKSSRTMLSDFLGPLDRFARWAQAEAEVAAVEPVLVYGGEAPQRRQGALVLPWSAVSTHVWGKIGPASGADEPAAP